MRALLTFCAAAFAGAAALLAAKPSTAGEKGVGDTGPFTLKGKRKVTFRD